MNDCKREAVKTCRQAAGADCQEVCPVHVGAEGAGLPPFLGGLPGPRLEVCRWVEESHVPGGGTPCSYVVPHFTPPLGDNVFLCGDII